MSRLRAGHGGPGALPHAHALLLPRGARRHRRVRHLLARLVRAPRELAAGARDVPDAARPRHAARRQQGVCSSSTVRACALLLRLLSADC